jgi:hypothetical protein
VGEVVDNVCEIDDARWLSASVLGISPIDLTLRSASSIMALVDTERRHWDDGAEQTAQAGSEVPNTSGPENRADTARSGRIPRETVD